MIFIGIHFALLVYTEQSKAQPASRVILTILNPSARKSSLNSSYHLHAVVARSKQKTQTKQVVSDRATISTGQSQNLKEKETEIFRMGGLLLTPSAPWGRCACLIDEKKNPS